MTQILLASGSETRQRLLRDAGVQFDSVKPRVDENSMRRALQAEQAPPRDIADVLASAKARKISEKSPGALVLGSDQVLDFDGEILGKPETPDILRSDLKRMNGKRHRLISAAVFYQDGQPLWRHVSTVRMHMRDCSSGWLDDYVTRNWDSVRHSAGGYHLEAEGARLFSKVEGDFFAVLGLPLIEVLGYLTVRGDLPG